MNSAGMIKHLPKVDFLTIRRMLGAMVAPLPLVGVCLFASCLGCNRSTPSNGSAGTQIGDPKVTWTYYESIQKADTEDEAEEIISDLHIDAANSESVICAASALREISTLMADRSKRMASLPVLNVDPDLTTFAVQLAQVRAETAVAANEYAALLREREELTSGANLGFSFLLSLAKHSHDGDNALWNALKEQIAEQSSELGKLKPKAHGVFDRASQVSKRKANIAVAEMEVRVKLAQKYGREFPPRADYLAAAKSAAARKQAASPYPISEKQMMRDLVGRRVSQTAPALQTSFVFNTFQPTLTFGGVEEFQAFTIVSSTNRANFTEYGVSTDLNGITRGQEKKMRLLLAYEKKDDVWKLRQVEWLSQK